MLDKSLFIRDMPLVLHTEFNKIMLKLDSYRVQMSTRRLELRVIAHYMGAKVVDATYTAPMRHTRMTDSGYFDSTAFDQAGFLEFINSSMTNMFTLWAMQHEGDGLEIVPLPRFHF